MLDEPNAKKLLKSRKEAWRREKMAKQTHMSATSVSHLRHQLDHETNTFPFV